MSARAVFGGPAAIVGDHISADMILPGRYSFLPPAEMACRALEEWAPAINDIIRRSRTLIAGTGFGYGSGRESPARALKAAGIELLLAPSFGRMFYRNAINQGLLAIECGALATLPIEAGDTVTADVSGFIRWRDQSIPTSPLPPLIADVIAAGGLVNYRRNKRSAVL